ncbi:DNA-directed RNA polymerase II polypeptide [Fasciola gigantica]|uniref:DNA-directed RNA polymerase II polypeptide n=2 Tax=Fasciola TaxID=6191 RepID=A0A4E0RN72_FASHE|nr:DNA-directed RNA polymerase II polypeptide [Fasciola hepatica]TPP67620.1 DNA-directed RNA polymerase II polypeptide [Fasciola gigantica]
MSQMHAVSDECDATMLKFPKEFESSDTLMLAEVKLLLEHRKEQNETATIHELELSQVFTKTLNYAAQFSKFSNRETIESVRALLSQKRLHSFELASVANLLPDTAEEAKALIPSLDCSRFTDEELQQLLDEIQSKRSFQA